MEAKLSECCETIYRTSIYIFPEHLYPPSKPDLKPRAWSLRPQASGSTPALDGSGSNSDSWHAAANCAMTESSRKQDGHASMLVFPFDITEAILSSIGSSATLLSLALTCTFWANHIIPRHIQYRTLWLGRPDERTFDVWAHLAIRKDLAKNIRNVRLIHSSPEDWRYPTSLVTPASDDFSSEREAILKALGNMDSLQRFSWQSSDFGESPLSDRDLASVLSQSRTLDCLKVTSTDSWIDVKTLSGSEIQNHPVRYYDRYIYGLQANPCRPSCSRLRI